MSSQASNYFYASHPFLLYLRFQLIDRVDTISEVNTHQKNGSRKKETWIGKYKAQRILG